MNDLNNEQDYYIEFLNKDKNFKADKIYFNSYDNARFWGVLNLDNFNTDMIKC